MNLGSREIISKIIGDRIRVRRKELRLTQDQLAHLLDIDKQYLYKLEKGKINISTVYLYEISKTLKVNIGWFFEGLPILLIFLNFEFY